jgi:hypothetical protein
VGAALHDEDAGGGSGEDVEVVEVGADVRRQLDIGVGVEQHTPQPRAARRGRGVLGELEPAQEFVGVGRSGQAVRAPGRMLDAQDQRVTVGEFEVADAPIVWQPLVRRGVGEPDTDDDALVPRLQGTGGGWCRPSRTESPGFRQADVLEVTDGHAAHGVVRHGHLEESFAPDPSDLVPTSRSTRWIEISRPDQFPQAP